METNIQVALNKKAIEQNTENFKTAISLIEARNAEVLELHKGQGEIKTDLKHLSFDLREYMKAGNQKRQEVDANKIEIKVLQTRTLIQWGGIVFIMCGLAGIAFYIIRAKITGV